MVVFGLAEDRHDADGGDGEGEQETPEGSQVHGRVGSSAIRLPKVGAGSRRERTDERACAFEIRKGTTNRGGGAARTLIRTGAAFHVAAEAGHHRPRFADR